MANHPEATPRAPAGLRPATKAWFLFVVERWELEPHHVRLLIGACRCWDEAEAAAAIVRTEGLLISMPSGARRPHPAICIGAQARALFARLLRELDLDVAAPAEARRPPALRSIGGNR